MEFSEYGLPATTSAAIDAGLAVIKAKFGNFCVVDIEDADLFDVLPLTFTKYGFAIIVTCKNGKLLTTNFAEIVKRQRGKARYNNSCFADLRKNNIEIEAWSSK